MVKGLTFKHPTTEQHQKGVGILEWGGEAMVCRFVTNTEVKNGFVMTTPGVSVTIGGKEIASGSYPEVARRVADHVNVPMWAILDGISVVRRSLSKAK